MIRCLFATVGRVIDALIPPSNPVVDPGELALQIIEEQHEVLEPASADGPAEASPAAGERTPEPRPAAGLPNDLIEAIADVLFDTRGMSANGQARAVVERVAIATPARFPFSDLSHAARVIRDYSDAPGWPDENVRLATRALANRLDDLSEANPTP